jgi:hypothetical protein
LTLDGAPTMLRAMRIRALAIEVLAAGAVACGKPGGEAAAPARPHYLAGVPLIPASIVTDTTGSPDAEHRRLVMQLPMDSVTSFYRRELQARGWRIVGDMADTAHVTLFLQRDSLSLWVQVRKLGPLATEYTLTAASQTPAAPAPRASP